jgi:transketolase
MNDDIMPLDPLPSKFRAFNWNVPDTVYDGRDIESIRESFGWLDSQKNGPNVIIYKTVMGKGVSFPNEARGAEPTCWFHFRASAGIVGQASLAL